MVFGGVVGERLQLNEDSVWAGEKLDRVNPQAAASIPEIRRLLFEGKPTEAEAIADRTMISVPRRMPPYQTLGDLAIRFQIDGTAADYRRELDLDQAVARVTIPRKRYSVHARSVCDSGRPGDRRAPDGGSPWDHRVHRVNVAGA